MPQTVRTSRGARASSPSAVRRPRRPRRGAASGSPASRGRRPTPSSPRRARKETGRRAAGRRPGPPSPRARRGAARPGRRRGGRRHPGPRGTRRAPAPTSRTPRRSRRAGGSSRRESRPARPGAATPSRRPTASGSGASRYLRTVARAMTRSPGILEILSIRLSATPSPSVRASAPVPRSAKGRTASDRIPAGPGRRKVQATRADAATAAATSIPRTAAGARSREGVRSSSPRGRPAEPGASPGRREALSARSRARSFVEAYRPDGSFARQRARIRRASSGTAAPSRPSAGGSSRMMAASASARKRSSDPASVAERSGRTFGATSRSSLGARPRQTSPMPPRPSGPETTYGPRREPGPIPMEVRPDRPRTVTQSRLQVFLTVPLGFRRWRGAPSLP